MTQSSLTDAGVRQAAQRAGNAVPPAFPLDASVAVNPFLGQTGERLETTAARLGRVAGISLAPPRPWLPELIAAGKVTDADLRAALRATPVLWIGSESFESLTVYGFYKEFSIDIAYPTVSYCSLTIEGLT